VRDPLKTIGSIWKTMGIEHQKWLEKNRVIPYNLKPKFKKAMHTWWHVNILCEEIADIRIRLEDIKEYGGSWETILRAVDKPWNLRFPKIIKSARNESRGIFKAKVITWQDMIEMDGQMCTAIAEMSHRYGYKVPERYRL
jgi:hypothetical protein